MSPQDSFSRLKKNVKDKPSGSRPKPDGEVAARRGRVGPIDLLSKPKAPARAVADGGKVDLRGEESESM